MDTGPQTKVYIKFRKIWWIQGREPKYRHKLQKTDGHRATNQEFVASFEYCYEYCARK